MPESAALPLHTIVPESAALPLHTIVPESAALPLHTIVPESPPAPPNATPRKVLKSTSCVPLRPAASVAILLRHSRNGSRESCINCISTPASCACLPFTANACSANSAVDNRFATWCCKQRLTNSTNSGDQLGTQARTCVRVTMRRRGANV